MKIVFKNRLFNGGSSYSLLEYVKHAKRAGHEVEVWGTLTKEKARYEKAGINQLVHFPPFDYKKPWKNLKILISYINRIQKTKPDLIIDITFQNSIFTKLASKMTGVPSLHLIPGMAVPGFYADVMSPDELIVFSEENKKELTAQGYNSSVIHVFPNRIDFSLYPEPDSYEPPKEKKRFLLVTRMDNEKINSIWTTFRLVKETQEAAGQEVELTIAGAGALWEEVKREAEKLQENQKIKVNMLGFIRDVPVEVKKHDFIAGKGRSVIDGMYLKKPSIVVNESDHYALVTEENVQALADYNFAGRNLSSSDEAHVFSGGEEINPQALTNIREFIKDNYSIEQIHDKLNQIIEKKGKPNNGVKLNYPAGIVFFITIYGKIIKYYASRSLKDKLKRK
ncbi:hypothetical protein CHL76_01415 [Marinococcus halophilus]|uniref:Glycosyltransferase subfamily 4-like N-terminal domain-containing protein n=1 Tax=Marinococcus halophilus TaxID=1371 RepID=A0A510Y335_MARHA|nr:glycosyltransferase family 4 protein [Marinococcus halophilus]OZT81780.1 hypothetical protein CHL76_01415 [Marinococcus halophilus]GEK57740.1 hypothetical protein MHA01_06450 [Marinococcus halophilus]